MVVEHSRKSIKSKRYFRLKRLMAKKVKYAIGFLNKQLKHQSVMLWVHIFYNIFQKLESNDMFRIQRTNKTIITLNAYVVHQRRFFFWDKKSIHVLISRYVICEWDLKQCFAVTINNEISTIMIKWHSWSGSWSLFIKFINNELP